METMLRVYRVLAWIVGVLTVLVVAGWLFKFVVDPGTPLYRFGETTGAYSWIHGYFYLALLVTAVLLGRRVGWSVPFMLTTMLLATIPFVSFWAEHRATRHTRELQAGDPAVGDPARR